VHWGTYKISQSDKLACAVSEIYQTSDFGFTVGSKQSDVLSKIKITARQSPEIIL